MLSYLKTIDNRVIIYPYIKYSTFRIQKSSNILHNYRCYAIVDDIPKVFELVMPILYDGELLSRLKVSVCSVPFLPGIGFSLFDVFLAVYLFFLLRFSLYLGFFYFLIYDCLNLPETFLEIIYLLPAFSDCIIRFVQQLNHFFDSLYLINLLCLFLMGVSVL